MGDNKFNIIKRVIEIVYSFIFMIICYYFLFKLGFLEWLDLDFKGFSFKFFSNFSILSIIYLISYYISLLCHELGHLYFGIKANLKFGSLGVLSFLITKEDNKLVIKRKKGKTDFKGMCYMIFDDSISYDKKEITLYFMGGIIFNIIFCLLFFIILLFSNNIYLDMVCLFFITMNIYLTMYNSVPIESKYGSITDMMQIIYIFNDPNYIKTLSKYNKIVDLIFKGTSYKDMDKKLFIKPKDFKYYSDVLMAIFYVDYMTSMGKYNEVVRYIKLILRDAKNILSKNHTFYLKIQLFANCLYNEKNYVIISEYWDNEFGDYLSLMGRIYPQFVYLMYVYYLKISIDKRKSDEALKLFYLMEKKYSDKKMVEEINKKIDELRSDE